MFTIKDLKPGDQLQTRSGYFYTLGKGYPFDQVMYRQGEPYSDLKYHDLDLRASNGGSRSDIVLVLRNGHNVFSRDEAIVFEKHPIQPKKEEEKMNLGPLSNTRYYVRANAGTHGQYFARILNSMIEKNGMQHDLEGIKELAFGNSSDDRVFAAEIGLVIMAQTEFVAFDPNIKE